MKKFKENTITFGTLGQTNLIVGLATVGMMLISTAFCLLTKDQYRFDDEKANKAVGDFRDDCRKAAKNK